MSTILQQIKTAIRVSGKSRYQIAQDSGVAQPQLSRLMSGERGLGLDAVEKLANALDLDIIIRPRKSRRQSKR